MTDREYLFVIDGSKALRSAIEAVFAERAQVQRCRTYKIRNVTEQLSKPNRQQVASVMRTAYKLRVDDGIVRPNTQTAWLKSDYPDAAMPLFEGREETLTANRLNLRPRLIHSLAMNELDRESEWRGTSLERRSRVQRRRAGSSRPCG
uniref:transposase n=1 Tax=Burkholderia arboris TaxID=488730 RepID=UPI003BEEBE2B